MKQFFTIILLVLAMQHVYSQSNVPNGNYENWHNVVVSGTLNYDDLGIDANDNWMATLNSLVAVPQSAGGPGPQTVFKTTDAHSGTYAAKAVTNIFPLGPVTITIPGMIGTAVMDKKGIRAVLGKPCPDCKPLRFKGYYKFDPVAGDSCAAVILLSKWNATAKKRDTIGYGRMVEHSPVLHYTPFDIEIDYTGTGAVDTMTLLVVSSAGFNVVKFMESKGQVGNTMYVDDLMLEYPAGIQQVLMPEVTVKVFPDPASDVLHVELDKAVKDGLFEVYTAAGKMVGSYALARNGSVIPVYSLPDGIYYYRLVSGRELMNTGTFIVKK